VLADWTLAHPPTVAALADAGMFSLFLDVHPDQAAAYKFGREPDGSPAEPWSWSEPAGR